MHNLFLVFSVNLYMYRAYLGPSSGDKTACIKKIGTYCSQMKTRKIDVHLKRIKSTNCYIHKIVRPVDGPRYTRNMQRFEKYTKNKLFIKLVFLYTSIYLSLLLVFLPLSSLLPFIFPLHLSKLRCTHFIHSPAYLFQICNNDVLSQNLSGSHTQNKAVSNKA